MSDNDANFTLTTEELALLRDHWLTGREIPPRLRELSQTIETTEATKQSDSSPATSTAYQPPNKLG